MRKNEIKIISTESKEEENTIIFGHDDIFELATGTYHDPQGIAYIINILEKVNFN